MSRSFAEHEKKMIQEKLIQSCEACWNRFGYRKTSVSQICEMAGISTGAFYLFYSSKELLFVETAQKVSKRLFESAVEDLPPNPTKYDCAKIIKKIAGGVKEAEWLLSLKDDLEVFARKLPPCFFENTQINDITDLSLLLEKYKLKTTVPLEDAAGILKMVMLPLLHCHKFTSRQFDRYFEYIVDKTVEGLFE